MRVLHIIARFNVGGTSSWISTLSRSLKETGNESILLCGKVQEGEVEDKRFHEIGGIKVSALGRRVAFVGDLISFWEIRKELLRIKPDVINTHTAKAGVIGRLANLSLGNKRFPLVHTIHGHLLAGYFEPIVVKIVILVETFLSKFTDVLLFAGEKVESDCLRVGIKHQRASFVVRPGVGLEGKRKDKSPQITVGWFARFADVKKPQRVIEVARAMPDVTFLMGGEGPLWQEVKDSAPGNCLFTGWTDPADFWAKCDVALLTSDNEALPISLIEAQLFGLPCVCTPAGSAPEVVIDGENGFVTSDFHPTSIITALRTLASDATLLDTFGQRGKQRAEVVFSPKAQLRDHLEAYRLAIDLREQASL